MSGKHVRPEQTLASAWLPAAEVLAGQGLGIEIDPIRKDPTPRWENTRYDAIKKELLARIGSDAIAAAESDAYLEDGVRDALMIGVSWGEIGQMLGLSGHVAYHRFDSNAKNHHARPDQI